MTHEEPKNTITSTRSNENEDTCLDFDDFDVDEELRRYRQATAEKQWAAPISTFVREGQPAC